MKIHPRYEYYIRISMEFGRFLSLVLYTPSPARFAQTGRTPIRVRSYFLSLFRHEDDGPRFNEPNILERESILHKRYGYIRIYNWALNFEVPRNSQPEH